MKHLIWKTTLWVHREKNGQKTSRRYRAIWRWSNRMNSLGTGIKQLAKIEELLNIQVQGQSCTNINLISYSKNRQNLSAYFMIEIDNLQCNSLNFWKQWHQSLPKQYNLQRVLKCAASLTKFNKTKSILTRLRECRWKKNQRGNELPLEKSRDFHDVFFRQQFVFWLIATFNSHNF